MIINSKIKNTSDAIDYLNRAVFGEDPETSVLTRVYEGVSPIQDRVTAVENSAALVDIQALKDKVDELNNLTEILANLAIPMPNIVSNGDLTLAKDSPNKNQALGFDYYTLTDITLTNGIATFTANAQFGRIQQEITYPDNSTIYYYARVKTTAIHVRLSNNYVIGSFHSGSNVYEFLSFVYKNNPATQPFKAVSVRDDSDFVPIEVDYIGAFNVSQMMLKGVKDDNGTPFTLLTDTQIKTQLDLWVQTRFPLDVLLMMRS